MIGLNDKESRVYLGLLKYGRVTPAALSRLTKINRATVYSVYKSLLSKGVIAEDLGGKTLYLSPLPPTALEKLIDHPRQELKRREKLVKEAIDEIGLIHSEKNYPVPKIRFIAEENMEDFLYDNGVKWVKELYKGDGVWWSFQDHSVVENYEEWIEWISKTKEYRDKRVTSKILSNDSRIEREMEKKIPRTKRDLRFLPRLNFTASIWISGDYMVMVVTRQHPFYLVEIHDSTLAHNMKEVLKTLWSLTDSKK